MHSAAEPARLGVRFGLEVLAEPAPPAILKVCPTPAQHQHCIHWRLSTGGGICCDHPALTAAQEEDLQEQRHEIQVTHHEVIHLISLNGVGALNVLAVPSTIVDQTCLVRNRGDSPNLGFLGVFSKRPPRQVWAIQAPSLAPSSETLLPPKDRTVRMEFDSSACPLAWHRWGPSCIRPQGPSCNQTLSTAGSQSL